MTESDQTSSSSGTLRDNRTHRTTCYLSAAETRVHLITRAEKWVLLRLPSEFVIWSSGSAKIAPSGAAILPLTSGLCHRQATDDYLIGLNNLEIIIILDIFIITRVIFTHQIYVYFEKRIYICEISPFINGLPTIPFPLPYLNRRHEVSAVCGYP